MRKTGNTYWNQDYETSLYVTSYSHYFKNTPEECYKTRKKFTLIICEMNNQIIKFYMYYDLNVEKQNVDLRQ